MGPAQRKNVLQLEPLLNLDHHQHTPLVECQDRPSQVIAHMRAGGYETTCTYATHTKTTRLQLFFT